MARGDSFSIFYIISLLILLYIDRIKLLVLVLSLYEGLCCLWWLGEILQRKSSWCEGIQERIKVVARGKSKRSFLFGGIADILSVIIIEGKSP